MKTLFLMLGLAACAGDIDANWAAVGPAQYAISDCPMSECYRAAAAVCPYGYDQLGSSSDGTSVTATPATMLTPATLSVRKQRTLLVQCKPPVFCDAAQCAYGYHCVVSHAYPGRNVCAF